MNRGGGRYSAPTAECNDALKARLNGALKTLTDDGSLERYALKYFPFVIHNEKWIPVD